MTAQKEIITLLELFIEEDDSDAMEQALSRIEKAKINIAGLLQHLENFKGDFQRKRRAIFLVRKQLGMSTIPGPACRPSP